MEKEKPITTRQFKALHLFFKNLSDHFNERGLDQREVLKPEIAIPFDQMAVKKRIWKPVQEAMFGTVSTKDLTTEQVNKILEVLGKHLGEQFQISEPFPSLEEMMVKYDKWNK